GADHVFEIANPAYIQLVGGRDVLGKPVREALPEIEGQGYFELLDQVYATGETFVGRGIRANVRRDPDGSLTEIFADLVCQPIAEPDGTVSGVFVLGIDVTEHQKAQLELQRHRERLEDLVRERTR